MKKVSIYIDGANYFHACSILKWQVDLARFYKYCGSYGEIAAAKFFCGESKTEAQEKFFSVLRGIGFEVCTKPIKTIYNKSCDKEIRKANCDVEITYSMAEEADSFDTAILVSGDSDFLHIADKLKKKGKEMIVISTKGLSAHEYITADDIKFIDMVSIKEQIERLRVPRTDREREAESVKRVSVFIDGANYFHACSILKWQVDLARFYKYCASYGEIATAKFFCGETKTEAQEKFFSVLRGIGFEVCTKPIKTIYNKSCDKEIRKANCDVEIACSMIGEADSFDTAILVSGNSDFLHIADKLKEKGKEMIVISTKGLSAHEYITADDLKFIDMVSIKEQIERRRELRIGRSAAFECGCDIA